MNKTRKNRQSRLNKETKKDMRDLVLARIKATSRDFRLSIGSTFYTKNELLKSVEAEDNVGKEIIKIQMEYLQDMASGAIYKDE